MIDLNPWSAAAATEATPPGRPIRWVTSNLFDYDPEGGIDLILSSQFTHHLDDDGDRAHFLRLDGDRRAALGWFIGDLHRHWFPYYGSFRLLSNLGAAGIVLVQP